LACVSLTWPPVGAGEELVVGQLRTPPPTRTHIRDFFFKTFTGSAKVFSRFPSRAYAYLYIPIYISSLKKSIYVYKERLTRQHQPLTALSYQSRYAHNM
jgi:hypothetical protein